MHNCPRGASKNVADRVLATGWLYLLESIQLLRPLTNLNTQSRHAVGHPGSEQYPTRLPRGLGWALANIVESCNPIAALGFVDYQSQAKRLLLLIGYQASMLDVDLFPQVLLPFVQDLSSMTTNKTHGGWVRTVLETKAAKAAFDEVLTQHQLRYVKKQPPSLRDWSRPRRQCFAGASCDDCWDLNMFLVSATQQVARFQLSKGRRQHIHEMLNQGFEGTHLTDRQTETLVVTKKDRGKEGYVAWFERCQTACDEIQKLDQALLKEILGAEKYEQISRFELVVTDLCQAPKGVQDAARRPLAPIRNPPAIASSSRTAGHGTKRKAEDTPPRRVASKCKVEVIDLCEDSDSD